MEKIISIFENTMAEIRKGSYENQVNLLVGYKKLLGEQINVIDSRIDMAKRAKS